jgi:hypothetical protein
MQDLIKWIGQVAVSVITSTAVIAFALRYLPDLIASWFVKKLDHRNQMALEKLKASLSHENTLEAERLKGEISATYSTLKSSVDFVAVSQHGLRIKMIDATEKLWHVIVKLINAFEDLHFIENILLPNELNERFKNDDWSSRLIHIKKYAREDEVSKRFSECGAEQTEVHRLFVSERLWLLFFVIRVFNGRIALLYERSFKQRQ